LQKIPLGKGILKPSSDDKQRLTQNLSQIIYLRTFRNNGKMSCYNKKHLLQSDLYGIGFLVIS